MSGNLLTEKRFIDLANQAERRDIVTFTDFLTLNELNILHQNAKKYATKYEISGGYEAAERQVAAFVPSMIYYDWAYPMDCLLITPAYPRFAEDLSHRDILGALMNLGIERGKLGDILVKEEGYYLFCKQEITDYICEELGQIRHTLVRIERSNVQELKLEPNLEVHEAIIASNRLDTVVGAMTKSSRGEAVQMIQSGKVFIQGKECLHNTYICKPNDVISIRSFGKFVFEGENGVTRKNRVKITYKKYV